MRWKMLIPFLLLSFIGTTILVLIGLSSQHSLIKKEEQKELVRFYQIFKTAIKHHETEALSIAIILAGNSVVQSEIAALNREALHRHLSHLYQQLKETVGIYQMHFHIPPAKSFLRMHLPEEFGELISYRREVLDAMKNGITVSGLEWGVTGLGIRGVAPIFHAGELVGTVEVGFPFDGRFLEELKEQWGADFTVYEMRGPGEYSLLASTLAMSELFTAESLLQEAGDEAVRTLIAPEGAPHKAVLLGPVIDYYGEAVALVQAEVDRSLIIRRLERTRNLMLVVGGVGIAISFMLTWLVAYILVRPVTEIVQEAEQIARGRREKRLAFRPPDEMGMLAVSLNTMLDSLQERRRQIAEYARTLERKVEERTADLVMSEEKYRTLVENIPLIVYRLLDDGTTEFINSCFTDKLGYSPEEVVGDRNFWWEKICGVEGRPRTSIIESCWDSAEELHTERVVRSKEGKELIFIDRALPALDEEGRVKWIDGTMVDITELKVLQERTLQTEEIRVLGEISARFAHEIRNPLAIAGGFARRLANAMPSEDPHRKFAQIIVEEVARLEDILQIILSSIEPFTLTLSQVNVNQTLEDCLGALEDSIQLKKIRVMKGFAPELGTVEGDADLIHRALECLLKHAIVSMPREELLQVSTEKRNGRCIIRIRHRADGLADEDLEQFFFPRVTGKSGSDVKDLPLSKVIIHRHGGKVTVQRDADDRILIRMELPFILPRGAVRQRQRTQSAQLPPPVHKPRT